MAISPLFMRFDRADFVTVTQYYMEKDVDHPLEQLLPCKVLLALASRYWTPLAKSSLAS